MSALPTGTVTFLFTDVEGSTALWEDVPEAMRAALARHDALIRAAIEAETTARASLGDAAFEAALDEGAALPLDQAVDFAVAALTRAST